MRIRSFGAACLVALVALVLVRPSEGRAQGTPPGTAPGTVLRVRGRGIPAGKNGSKPGDLLVKVDVLVPSTLTDEQRAAVESLGRVTEPAPREHLEEV